MAFTGQLGTSASSLGNIQLGAGPGTGGGGGTSANESLNIAGTANLTIVILRESFPTLSLDVTSSIAQRGGFEYFLTEQLDATAAATTLSGFLYLKTLSIDATARLDAGVGVLLTVSIAGTASISLATNMGGTNVLTISASADFSSSLHLILNPTLNLTSIGQVSSPGGLVLLNSFAIEGLSSISFLVGFGYSESISIDGTSDFSEIEQYSKNVILTIDGTAAINSETIYITNPLFIIAGTSSITLHDLIDMVQSFSIGAKSEFKVENLYDYLFVSQAIASIGITLDYVVGTAEIASASAGFSAVAQVTYNRTISQTLNLVQNIGLKRPKLNVIQTLSLNQSIGIITVRNKTISQTLTLTQAIEPSRPLTNTLTITQTVVGYKVYNRSVVQSLNLQQSVNRNIVSNQHISQTLIFNPPTLRSTPITGSKRFEYYTSPVIGILIPRKCLVILSTSNQTVVLPCPQFGDSEAYQGTINLKRTMTGSTLTYIKQTELKKLKYTFQLGTRKYLELRDFILAHPAEVITLTNWKGEIWYVYITNNPVEFTVSGRWQPVGELTEVTLEFEGVKL